MFSGYRFRALGEAKTPAVKSAVESFGGQMVLEVDDEVDFIIVRLVRYVHDPCLSQSSNLTWLQWK
jgi:hypothetical protein